MTEKLFIRIVDHLEKEVIIYDTINEKKIFNIFFNELDSAICLNGALTDTVDLLNDLSEENEQLKSDNRLLYSRNTDLKRKNELYDAENEQLKQSIKEIDDAELHLKQIILKRIDDYIWEWEDEGTPVAQVLRELQDEIKGDEE